MADEDGQTPAATEEEQEQEVQENGDGGVETPAAEPSVGEGDAGVLYSTSSRPGTSEVAGPPGSGMRPSRSPLTGTTEPLPEATEGPGKFSMMRLAS